VVVKVAAPVASSVAAPSTVRPSRKVTVPVGVAVPEPGLTVAVNVTGWL
jgi:hypothetical protein